ncbi:MAG: NAD(P)-dependent oxidoreductase [Chloroflexi bacterium]|nr:NAD(P)-dependent oxidoreductase [Chloroflexota bacterium]
MAVSPRRTVLVTGATGYIASQLLPAFRERYDVRAIDARPDDRQGNPVEGVDVLDLATADLATLRPWFAGCDTVVHLAYYRPPDANLSDRDGWLTRGYIDERTNVDMAQRVLQLALEEGVRRVVMASSNHAADWYEELLHVGKMDVVDPDRTPPRSDNYYGWAKAAYELLGFMFATGVFGRKLENVQLRIGAPREISASTFFPNGPDASGDAQRYARDLGAYLSQRDLQQLVIKSIETSNIEDEHGIPFQIFYGISNNTRAFWSLVNARRVIGYAPEDDAEITFADEIRTYLVAGARRG